MNTLRYAKKLEEVGFSREQAEMTIGILNEVVEGNLASKLDLKDFAGGTKQQLSELSSETNQRFNKLSSETNQRFNELSSATNQRFNELSSRMTNEFALVRMEMHQLKSDLTIKLGAIMVTGIAVIATLIKLM